MTEPTVTYTTDAPAKPARRMPTKLKLALAGVGIAAASITGTAGVMAAVLPSLQASHSQQFQQGPGHQALGGQGFGNQMQGGPGGFAGGKGQSQSGSSVGANSGGNAGSGSTAQGTAPQNFGPQGGQMPSFGNTSHATQNG